MDISKHKCYELNTMQLLLEQTEKFKKAKEPDFDLKQIVWGFSGRIVVSTIEDFLKARRWMDSEFGEKKYQKNNVFHACGQAICTWKNGGNMAIWLECDIEDFPECLQSEKCKFVETKRIISEYEETSIDYVCNF